jgi:hypothetical protein
LFDILFIRSPAKGLGRRMPLMIRARRCYRHLLLALAACAALVAPTIFSPSAAQEPAADPLPIRRVLIPPERVPAELERLRPGTLVRMPREDFEARVRQAAQAADAAREPPRLVEARYTASLADLALIGTGQWKVLNSSRAGILPVTPLNLALQKVLWQKAQFDRADAILGELDGKSPGLLVEQAGEQTAYLDWTARGDPKPEGLHFDLQVPASPVASLELNLPADRVVAVSREAYLLSGPQPAEAADRRLWRIDFAGRSQVDLVIRRLPPAQGADAPRSGGEPPPLILAELQSRQELEPGLVRAEYRFDVQVPRHGVRELRLECDPSLRPYEVTARDLEGWELRESPPAPAGKERPPPTLVVRLNEPFQGGAVQVRCLAPLAVGQPWTSPTLRLAGALIRGETVVLRVHPDMQLEHWQAGDFRLTGIATEADGWQALTLGGTGPRRPGVTLKAPAPEYRARQLAWWQVGPERSALTTQLTYTMARGRLFRLPVRLPAGWVVDRVELSPAALLRHWTVQPAEQGQGLMLIDLQRPLGEEDPAARGGEALPGPVVLRPRAGSPPRLQLTVRLHPGGGGAPAAGALAFPVVEPVGARFREGLLAVSVDPQYQATVSPPLAATAPEERDAPWAGQAPDFFYTFRDQDVRRVLQLRPRRPRVRARGNSELVITPGGAAIVTRLVLEPDVGNPDAVDLLVSPPVSGPWSWKTENGPERVRQAERLWLTAAMARLGALTAATPLEAAGLLALPPAKADQRLFAAEIASGLSALAAGTPLEAAGFRLSAPPGEWWRLTLEGLLREPLALQATATVPGRTEPALARNPEGGPPRLPNRPPDTLNERAVLAVGPPDGDVTPVALAPPGQAVTGDLTADPVADRARLTVAVHPAGGLRHHYEFRLWHWTGRTLPVRLPAGARPQVVRVDGRSVAWLPPAAGDDRAVVLPVPSGGAAHRFEVVYALGGAAWNLGGRLDGSVPDLPVRLLDFRRTWRLPPRVVPLSAETHHRLPEPASAAEAPKPTGDGEARPGVLDLASSVLDAVAEAVGPVSAGRASELFADGPALDWTEWEADAGVAEDEKLLVVRADALPKVGLALAAVLALVFWQARHAPVRAKLLLLLAWLGVACLALVWLPQSLRGLARGPVLAGALLALAWYLLAVTRARGRETKQPEPGSRTPTPLPHGALALLLAAGLGPLALLSAAPPAPVTVFLVAGPADAPAKQTALVPPELLEQLQTLAGRAAPAMRPAVLLGARYEGAVTGAAAELRADFQVHCFSDAPAALTLPLGGVQLREALFDGAPAHPVALPPPREGYTLEVKGRGGHAVTLRFAAPVSATGDDRDLRFTIPELGQSRLVLDVPPGSGYLYGAAGKGLQRVSPAPGPRAAAEKGLRLEADLGRVSTLHARWREEGARPKPPLVYLREAYLWELHPAASRLFAVLQYRVKEGAATTFALDLPEQAEVLSVGAERLPEAGTDDPVPRLREWLLSSTAGRRQLRFEFQHPVARGVQVTLELVSPLPVGPGTVLPVPVPQGTPPVEESLLAYRAGGLDARYDKSLRLLFLQVDAFRAFWKLAGMGDPGQDLHAYSFRRPGGAPLLQLNLQLPAPHVQCVQNLTWQVGPRQADLTATATLKAPGRDLILVEWDVPPAVEVAEVSGPEVRGWSRPPGSPRLQVWLQAPQGETTVRLAGWLPLHAPGGATAFALPGLRLRPAQSHVTYVTVTADSGLALQPAGLRNLGPLPDTRPSDREFSFVTDKVDYGGVFQVHRAPVDADVRVLSVAEVQGHGLRLNATVDYAVRPGERRTLTVRLRNWRGEDVRLEAPQAVQRPEARRDAGGRAWTVEVPGAPAGRYQMRLSGGMRLEGPAEVLMPDVAVEAAAGGAGRPEVKVAHWVAVAGDALKGQDPRGLTSVADPAAVLAWCPAEAERVRRAGAVWRVSAADWHLRLLPSPAAGSPPVQVFLAEQAAAVADGRQWAHQATYWLYQEAGTDLHVTLPAKATVVAVDLDGRDVKPLRSTPGHVWLSLPRPGAHRLGLRWAFDPTLESLDRPKLEPPKLEGVGEGPAVWTVAIPPGFHAGESKPGAALGAAGAADLDLRRAAAELQLGTVLAERAREGTDGALAAQFRASQGRFDRFCGRAEKLLVEAGSAFPPALPELREKNRQLTKAPGVAKLLPRDGGLPAEQGAEVESHPLPGGGSPAYWDTAARAPVPRLRLVASQAGQLRDALPASLGIGAALLAAWGLSRFPRLVAWVLVFWPEQMALLGCLGWVGFGPSWAWLFLLLLGVGGRLASLGRWFLALVRQPAPAPAPAGSGSGSS